MASRPAAGTLIRGGRTAPPANPINSIVVLSIPASSKARAQPLQGGQLLLQLNHLRPILLLRGREKRQL